MMNIMYSNDQRKKCSDVSMSDYSTILPVLVFLFLPVDMLSDTGKVRNATVHSAGNNEDY